MTTKQQKTTSAGSVDAAKATLRKALEREWRLMSALCAELHGEIATANAATDAEGQLYTVPTPAKANLPLAERKRLMGVIDARLTTAQAEAEAAARKAGEVLPDPETVRRQLIAHIRQELAGTIHPNGLALVYWQGKLVPFDHRRATGKTSESDYLVSGLRAKGPSRTQIALIIGGAVVGLISAVALIWNLLLAPSGGNVAGGPAMARIGDQITTRWDVQAAAADGQELRVQAGTVSYPLLACAPAGVTLAPGGTVVVTGTTSLRRYTLAAVGGTDLTVVACANPAQILATGTLASAQATLPSATDDRVRDVWVRGPGTDPQAIPSDRMEIAVLVADDLPEARLVLADGTTLAPSNRTPTDAGVLLTYLAPLSATSQDAGLHVATTSGMVEVSPLALPAPESRLSYLGQVLTVTDAQVERTGATVQATLRVVVRTDRGEVLALLSDDLRITQSAQALTAAWSPPTLPGDGSPQIIVVTWAIASGTSPITLRLGTWQATIPL